MSKTELLVIGGGPGGYTAAIRAAQLGRKVTLVEGAELGGVCLNRGCIPTKVYLKAAEMLSELQDAAVFGIKIDGYRVDREALLARKKQVVSTLVGGVRGLLRANGVEVINDWASFTGPRTVQLKGGGKIEADKMIIATGSRNAGLNFPGSELPGVIDSDQALELGAIPSSLAIIGGGVIGIEFAEVYAALGAKVTIIEALPRILAREDAEISSQLQGFLQQKGMQIFCDARVTSVHRHNGELQVSFTQQGQEQRLQAAQVLVAVGRRPNIEDLNLERAGIDYERAGIKVNEYLQTSNPDVYAIGDVNGGMQLAHVASYEGEKAAEHLSGGTAPCVFDVVPRCIFSSPEVGAVGLTEEEAREQAIDYVVGRFPFMANGKALLRGESKGLIKLIAGKQYKELLGVHIIGPGAGELIAEAGLALKLECTVDELIDTIHAHPTVSESYREAAMAALGRAIHIKQ